MSETDAQGRASGAASQDRGLPALIVGVGVVCALHVGKLPVAIPVLQSAFELSLLKAGFLLSLVQLAGMSLGLLVGMAADHLGPRRVMLTGLGLLALGSAWGGAVEDVNGLLGTRVLEGLGFLLAVLPAPGLLRQQVHDPKTLARALGWWGAYMPLGTALALLLGAPLMERVGWRPVWLALSLLTLAAAVWLAHRVQPSDALKRVANPSMNTGLARRLTQTLAAPGPWLVAVAFFLYSGQWLAVVGFLPTIYQQAGFGGAALGGLTAVAAAINMAGNIGAGKLMARGAQPGTVLVCAYSAMALGALVAFGADGHPYVQYVAVLIFSGVGGLIPGTLFGLAVELAPSEGTVSTTVGWMQQFSALGQFLGPPLVAWVATVVGGWQLTWLVTGSCLSAGIGMALLLQRAWRLSRAT